jgi:hypothetical protein
MSQVSSPGELIFRTGLISLRMRDDRLEALLDAQGIDPLDAGAADRLTLTGLRVADAGHMVRMVREDAAAAEAWGCDDNVSHQIFARLIRRLCLLL